MPNNSDIQKDQIVLSLKENIEYLLIKYTSLIFTFNLNDETHKLYSLNKSKVYNDFGFKIYCDFLYKFFPNLFFVVEFNYSKEIYFIMKNDLQEVNFSYTSDSFKICCIINDEWKMKNFPPICVL